MIRKHISIVVCTYNQEKLLAKALDSMIHQKTDGKFSFDIIVIDDGSTDGTMDIIKEYSEKSEISFKYFLTEGKGVSHARNKGITESCGEWIAFFDQDQFTESDWLMELFTLASKISANVVDGPRHLALSEEQLSRLSSVSRRELGERLLGSEPRKYSGRTPSCTGNVLINHRVFDVVGKFDESIIHGGEDWDYFYRVKVSGFDIWYAPKAIVYHIIPNERFTKGFFIWNSLRCGINFAYRDYKEWGLTKTFFACIARIGQAFLVNTPLLFWSYLVGNDEEALGRKCLLWRAVGYTRYCLFLISPRLFAQERFFSRLEFRKEREIFPKDSNITEKDPV